MKKLLLVVAVLALAIGNANAEEKYVAGGFEASGHVNTGFGFQYIGKDSANAGGAAALFRDGWGSFTFADKNSDLGFILDEVELDLTKTFGENIRFRTDLEFKDANIGSNALNLLEQAYVTANIAAGNGIELLFGRFNAAIGFEAVDRNENDTLMHNHLFNLHLRPDNLTGMKIYYAFTDAVDLHFYVVNNLLDGVAAFNYDVNVLPSLGFRLGYTWGEEGTESTIGLSAAGGPQMQRVGKKIGRLSYLADLDWNIWATDAFAIGGEGIFRIDNANNGATDAKYFGGLLNFHYAFSDVWDGTLKYALLSQNNQGLGTLANTLGAYGPATGAKALFHEIGLAGGYQITDGAKFKAEYRLDWTKYTGLPKNWSHAVLGMFAYEF